MNICIFGASADIRRESYYSNVEELSEALGRAGHNLVFGGFSNGLMKAAADGFGRTDAEITGVIPRIFLGKRTVHPACTKTVACEDLAGRKAKMTELSDAFITAPGSMGTFDELFEVLALKQIHEIEAPIILFNIDGFYDELYAFLQHADDEHFMPRPLEEMMSICSSKEEVLEILDRQ